VIDRATAGDPPHDANAPRRDEIGGNLLDRVLVAADDDRRRVDVEEQEVVAGHLVPENVLLECEVEVSVGMPAVVDEDHGAKGVTLSATP